ncbi:A24 family peptidase [Achromobacter sp. Marseille-Q4962]|uniref:prepilin peptidase n=1 Tax=Achromobacter sp. Marseille-Q4962 TaxID=2942202 RepID=UPI0020744C66|nr:A24 family peptidase [Achromobacter sp. Marseille-Q4962]
MTLWHEAAVPLAWFVAAAALLGLAVGNGLAVLSRRLPRAMEREWQAQIDEAAGGAARAAAARCAPPAPCPQCESWRPWGARLPLASWRRREDCPGCGARAGWRYPVLETLSCLLFAACAWRFGPAPIALCAMALVAALLLLAWIDIETSLLPDALTLPLLWGGLLVNLDGGFTSLRMAVLGAAAGYGFLWLVFHVFRLCTGREGMGFGDFKLLAALGAWFGLEALPLLLLVASLAGVLGGGALALQGRAARGQALPFGPYLALAGLAVLFLGGEPGLWRIL